MAETGAALLGTDTELYCAPVLGCLTVDILNSEFGIRNYRQGTMSK